MFDWFVWTPVTQFMLVKLALLMVVAGVIGWRQGWYGGNPPKRPTSRPRNRPGYTEAERSDTGRG